MHSAFWTFQSISLSFISLCFVFLRNVDLCRLRTMFKHFRKCFRSVQQINQRRPLTKVNEKFFTDKWVRASLRWLLRSCAHHVKEVIWQMYSGWFWREKLASTHQKTTANGLHSISHVSRFVLKWLSFWCNEEQMVMKRRRETYFCA